MVKEKYLINKGTKEEKISKLTKGLKDIQIVGVNTTLLNKSYKLYLSIRESECKYENRIRKTI